MPMKKEPPRKGLLRNKPEHKLGPTEYPPSFGRVDPAECTHAIFLDYVYPFTGICLDCGVEHMCCETWATVQPETEVQVMRGGKVDRTFKVEGRVLTDDELTDQRHVYHGIWALAGWTQPDPDEDPVPPKGLQFKGGKRPQRAVSKRSASVNF